MFLILLPALGIMFVLLGCRIQPQYEGFCLHLIVPYFVVFDKKKKGRLSIS